MLFESIVFGLQLAILAVTMYFLTIALFCI